MKRKIIQVAESTQLVSLPRKWALSHNLKKGDEIEVTPKGSQLIISTVPTDETRRASIEISARDPFLRRRIDSLYRAGYDEVEIHFDNSRVLRKIQDTIPLLLGYEIVSQGPRSCMIRNIASTAETEFDVILRRVFTILCSFSQEIYDAASRRELTRFQEIALSESMLNKFCNLCERILNKNGHGDVSTTNQHHYLVCQMEVIGDDLFEVCAVFSKKPNLKPEQKLIDLIGQVNDFLLLFRDYYYKRDPSMQSALKGYQESILLHLKGIDDLSKKFNHRGAVAPLYEVMHTLQHLSVQHF